MKYYLGVLNLLIFILSTPVEAEVTQDILLKCTYERQTSTNQSISKFSPNKSSIIFYLDPVGKNFYDQSKSRIEASIDNYQIGFGFADRFESTSFKIDRLTGLLHVNKIIKREKLIELNSSYSGGDLVETFEGECVSSDGAKQF